MPKNQLFEYYDTSVISASNTMREEHTYSVFMEKPKQK
jgi:hypothetical protein